MARNPDPESSLPFLLRLPIGEGIVLKVRDVWPRTSKVYCHRAEVWPVAGELEVVERVHVRSCVRRGAAIDLVLDRGRENRSQFVFSVARGREVIFWQSARTAKQARPNVATPTARAAGHVLDVLVDVHERYPWRFSAQQATLSRRALAIGDYAVEHAGAAVGVVERKSLDDLVSTLVGGKLRYLMAALASVPRGALVVEDRWSAVFKLERVRPAVVADGLAEAQVRFPSVPIVFAETRPLAQEWAYRFLGAALAHALEDGAAASTLERLEPLAPLPGLPTAPVPAATIRRWAAEHGLAVPPRGRVPAAVVAAYDAAHGRTTPVS